MSEYEGAMAPRIDWVPAVEDATGDEEADLESLDVPLGVLEPGVTAAGARRGETFLERTRREEPEHDPMADDLGELVIDDEASEENPSEATGRFGTPLGLSPEERALHIDRGNELGG